jgi:translation initiation factor IF-1
LSRDDLIHIEGDVIKTLGGGLMAIECANNNIINAKLSGRMKKNKIKVIPGDHVRVSVSPYDISHGLITYRF